MKCTLVGFGTLEVEGERYEHDVVIEHGQIAKRKKKASKAYRDRYAHTPLSAEEHIPWHGKTLYVGTGAHGALPVMPEVYEAARRHGVEVVARPTVEVCKLIEELAPSDVNAILHVTC
jgi:hypothetical protein